MTRKGFTLVEILIVVIILGILAAIVIPQFTDASNDARLSAQQSDLQTIRGQLELYRMQHTGSYPTAAWGGAACQMTNTTTIAGVVDPAGTLGPYMQDVPANPFQPAATAQLVDITWDGAAATDATAGWFYHVASGRIEAGIAP